MQFLRSLQDELIGSFLCSLVACGPTLNRNCRSLFVFELLISTLTLNTLMNHNESKYSKYI